MRTRTWVALTRLGSAVAQVAASEVQAVRSEMKRSARISASAMVTIGVALVLLAVSGIALMMAAVEALSQLLDRWTAFLAFGLICGAAAVFLLWFSRRRLKSIEPPATMVKRRWREHRSWARKRISAGDDEAAAE